MRRFLLLAALGLFLTGELLAQGQQWIRSYGGLGDQFGYAIETTTDGGFLIGGNTTLLEGDAQSGYWVIRLDSLGGKIWEKSFSKQSIYTKLWSLRPTKDGGMLLAGFNGIQFGGNESALLYKISGDGSLVWEKEIDYQRSDHAHFLVERKSYGYYIAGHTDSRNDPTGEMWLVKLDDDRTLVWEKVYKLNFAEHCHAGQETSDGGCILAGHTYVNGFEKIWAMRVDSNGTTMWSKVFSSGDEYHDSPYYAITTKEGGFAIFGGSGHASKPFGTGWLIVTDGDGNVIVDRHYGRASQESFVWSGRQTSDGGFILAGYTTDSATGGTGDIDMYVVKTDAAGNPQWEKRIGGEGHDEAFGVVEVSDGYVVSGQTTSPSLQSGTSADLLVVKLAKNGTVASVTPVVGEGGPRQARAYPNPVSAGNATIELASDAGARPAALHLVDRLGSAVRTLEPRSAGDRTFTWDLRDADGRPVPAGVYLYRSDDGSVSGKIVVAGE